MNFKKIALTSALIAGLSLGSVSQMQANSWHSTAGVITGIRAGLRLPKVIVNPGEYIVDTLATGLATLIASYLLSMPEDSRFVGNELEQHISKSLNPTSDFRVGFRRSFTGICVTAAGIGALLLTGVLAAGTLKTITAMTP